MISEVVTTVVHLGSEDYDDFVSNILGGTVVPSEIDEIMFNENIALKKVSYSDFKTYIDGTTITWADVMYIDYGAHYELWLFLS